MAHSVIVRLPKACPDVGHGTEERSGSDTCGDRNRALHFLDLTVSVATVANEGNVVQTVHFVYLCHRLSSAVIGWTRVFHLMHLSFSRSKEKG